MVNFNIDIIDKLYDKELRQSLRQDTKATLQAQGWDEKVNVDAEIVVKTNTQSKYYLVMPNASQLQFGEREISEIQAAGQANTAGCLGSISTASSYLTTIFTVASILTASSAK